MPDVAPNAAVAEDSAFREAVREGIADADDDRTVDYDAVRRWLLSWGTESELPPLECE